MGLLDLLNQITNNDNKFIYDTKIIKDEKSKEQKELERKRMAALNAAEKQRVKSTLNMELPVDFENIFANDVDANSIKCDSSSDGLMLSLANKGKVDIQYISQISGRTIQEVINDLKGSILQNPQTWNEVFYEGWETKEEYLSGNLKEKYDLAVSANKKYPDWFTNNIKAIEAVTDSENLVSSKEIFVTLGSPWLPTKYIAQFAAELIDVPPVAIEVLHDLRTGSWNVRCKIYLYATQALKNTKTFGTSRINAINIIEKTLNQSNIEIFDKVKSIFKSKKKELVKNEGETLLAIDKQKQILDRFNKWIFADQNRKQEITEIYNSIYCQNYKRHYSGDFLTFPGINPEVEIYPFQKNAVARMIFSNNTLLAHDVGSGKTYEMICAAQEMKRMGFSKKNMIVVPNNIITQWESMYKYLYPNSKTLVVSNKNFNIHKRHDTLLKMRDEDYDSIIITYSSFESIQMSPDFKKAMLNNEAKELDESYYSTTNSTTAVKHKRTNMINKKYRLSLEEIGDRDPDEIYFDDLKIDRLFVDEAHNFKNVPLETNIKVLGISTSGSRKCLDMMDKVHYIQSQHLGKGVTFATGTPITNSISDIYVMQKYLQDGDLNLLKIDNFNSWIANFAEKESEFEIAPDTSEYRLAVRYSTFHNLPELSSLLSSIADFHHIDKEKDLPNFAGYTDSVIKPTPEFEEFLKWISTRADLIKNRKPMEIGEDEDGNPIKDNMLVVTVDGRKAALDLRLALPDAPAHTSDKVYRCAENIVGIYNQTNSFKGTQLVFCDVSTPKQGFNIYDELKRVLLDAGIPECEIAYVHDATTDSKKEAMFKKVNKGEIRVLIGSTFKLGTGVNVQERLYAIHHIDVPWRPADMIQREGRILRPGNSNSEIKIFRYITEKSFDAYSWQLLETKQKFITKLLSNDVQLRSASDIEDAVLNYAEVKALAIGNPLIKERVETYNELVKLVSLRDKESEKQQKLKADIALTKERLPRLKEIAKQAKEDFDFIKTLNLSKLVKDDKTEFNSNIYRALVDNMSSVNNQEKEIIQYQGFKIIAPAYQVNGGSELFLYIQRKGKYHLKIGNTANGVFTRIYNFFDGFQNRLDSANKSVRENMAFIKGGEQILQAPDKYSSQIDELRTKLQNIDIKLGVK